MKTVRCLIFATAAFLLVSALPADARAGGNNHGFKGHSNQGFSFQGHSNQGFKGHHHGFKGHHHQAHGFHHRSHFRSRVFVGVGVAPVWWWGWPGYYPYPAYAAPVVIQQSPPVYIQQDAPAEPYYWYYCEGAQAYYPYVQQCPNGWMKVVPPTNGPKPN